MQITKKTGMKKDVFYFGTEDIDRLNILSLVLKLSIHQKAELTTILNKIPEGTKEHVTQIILNGKCAGAVGCDVGGDEILNIELEPGKMTADACVDVAKEDLLNIFELQEKLNYAA